MTGAPHHGLGGGWAALALAAAMAAAGCGSAERHVYFRPAEGAVGAGPNWVAKARYDLPPGAAAVELALAARGQVRTTDRSVAYDTLNVLVEITNRGPAAFSMDPAAVRLFDDEGRAVAGAEAYAGRHRTGAITLAGGARAAYELVFDLPGATRLERLGSVRLTLPYRCGDQAGELAAKFLKIEQVNYYYPAPYPYDPWYDDPWYGPWGRRRTGFGYYHGW